MIGYQTHNMVSQNVMKAFQHSGVPIKDIADFFLDNLTDTPIFYGILRGTGRAIIECDATGRDFYYLDNGYFGAQYMDAQKYKEMNGTYRVVKNALIEPADVQPIKTATGQMRVLLLPPSPYSAFMYDTTPEDWNASCYKKCAEFGHMVEIKNKEPGVSTSDYFNDYDAVLAFNSMAVMGAIEMGKAVYTTHGIIPNFGMLGECAPYYDIDEVRAFYAPKQFTLEQIRDLGVACLN